MPASVCCWRKAWWLSPGTAAAEFSGWQWGEKAERGPEPPAYCCLQSWKSQSSRDHTLHMKVHFHQLQLSLHLFSSPGPGLSRWEPSLLPEPCLATPRPAFQALSHLHSSPSRGLGVAAALALRPPLILNLRGGFRYIY